MPPVPHRLLQDYSYAIVDRARVAVVPGGITLHPLVPAPLADVQRMLPALVDLSSLEHAVYEECLDRLQKEQGSDASLFCALLCCDADLASLARALQASLVADFDGEPRYFRYFDPRVFCQLTWILEPAQYCRIFADTESWAYPLDGDWHRVYKPSIAPVLRLRFSRGQVDRLDRLQTINKVLSRLPASRVPESSRRPALGRQAYDLSLAARRHGIHRESDIALFLNHGLTLHPRFYEHPVFATRLAALDHDLHEPYRYAVADLSTDDQERVALELTRD